MVTIYKKNQQQKNKLNHLYQMLCTMQHQSFTYWIKGESFLFYLPTQIPTERNSSSHIAIGNGFKYLCPPFPNLTMCSSDGGLETWLYGSRSRLSKVSVSSRSRGSKVSVLWFKGLGLARHYSIETARLERRKKWQKRHEKSTQLAVDEKMMFFV